MRQRTKVFSIAFTIFVIGFFLRFYHIQVTPPGIYPDEAVNGQDALKVLSGEQWQWFYPDNQGREGLFINLIAISFSYLGVSVMSLKLPSIIFGSLTVVGTFFLARELFRNDRVALMAAAFNATAFTAVNFSRIAFRANMLPFVLVWSFYFLYKGLHTKRYRDFIFAGAIFGIGMHTYIAFRIAPIILLVLVMILLVAHQEFLREQWRKIGAFVLAFMVIAMPMFYTFWIHPDYFNARAEHVFVFSPEVHHGHPVQFFTKALLLSLAKYTFVSDMNWRNNYPPYPLLDPVMAVCFLYGFFVIIRTIVRSFRRYAKDHVYTDDLIVHPFLVIWFLAMLTPEFLTYESNPHALRSIGALPMVYITAALGLHTLFRRMVTAYPARKKRIVLSAIGACIFIVIFDPIKYFGFWAQRVQTAIYFEKNITQLAYEIHKIPQEQEVVVILGNMQRVPVRIFNWGRQNYMDVNPFDMEKIMPQDPDHVMIFFSDFHKADIVATMTARYPHLQLREIVNDVGQKYYVLQ